MKFCKWRYLLSIRKNNLQSEGGLALTWAPQGSCPSTKPYRAQEVFGQDSLVHG